MTTEREVRKSEDTQAFHLRGPHPLTLAGLFMASASKLSTLSVLLSPWQKVVRETDEEEATMPPA